MSVKDVCELGLLLHAEDSDRESLKMEVLRLEADLKTSKQRYQQMASVDQLRDDSKDILNSGDKMLSVSSFQSQIIEAIDELEKKTAQLEVKYNYWHILMYL